MPAHEKLGDGATDDTGGDNAHRVTGDANFLRIRHAEFRGKNRCPCQCGSHPTGKGDRPGDDTRMDGITVDGGSAHTDEILKAQKH